MCKKENCYKSNLQKFIFTKSKELGIDDIAILNIKDYKSFENDFKSEVLVSVLDAFPECKTIISASLSYNYIWNNTDNNATGYIAKYTVCNFYKLLRKKLKILASDIQNYFFPEIKKNKFYKIFVNSKLNEKLIAYAAKLGFFTKNSLISTKNGSKVVLGEILLSEEIETGATNFINQADYCQKCSLCIDSCPTHALSDYKIDKNKCLQHLSTLENWTDDKYFKLWGKRFYGCSLCSDVCPINRKYVKDGEILAEGFIGFTFDPCEIVKLKKENFSVRFANNQLSASWVKEYLLARNALLALFNMQRDDIITQYLNNLSQYNWDFNELNFLKNFCEFLLNKSNKK